MMTALRMLLAVAIGLALVLLLFWATQRSMIYIPSGDVPTPSIAGLPDAIEVTFPTEDGLMLKGWFVAARSAPTGDALIVFNGNAGNRAYRADIASGLADAGIQVLLFDYRGYGGNAGSPSEEGLAMDARAARKYLAARPGIDPHRIAYFGESLGAGVAVRLARDERPSALLLRSPFTSLVDAARHHFPYLPVRWLLTDRFASIETIATLRVPVLVITAAHDSVVPSGQSRRLFDAAPQPKRLVVIEGVDHNDAELVAGPRVIAEVRAFLNESRR